MVTYGISKPDRARRAITSTRLFAWLASIVLASCGGGQSSVAPAAPSSASSAVRATATVVVHLAVPQKLLAQVAQRKTQYVAATTVSLVVTLTPAGGTPEPSIVGSCTSTCTATFTAPVGNDVIALALTDASGGGGNPLSITNGTNVTVVPNVTNTFNLTANPVVDHVGVSLAASTVTAGTAAAVPLTVSIQDADGNTIVGPGTYVDKTGAPVTVTLSEADYQAAGGGTFALSQSTLVAPPSSAITAQYNGKGVDHAVFSIAATGAVTLTAPSTTLTTVPSVTNEYATPAGVEPNYFAIAGDGNIWFTAFDHSVVRLKTDGTMTRYVETEWPVGIAADATGNLWFPEQSLVGTLRQTSPAVWALSEYPIGSVGPFGSPPPQEGIALGNDGNMWLTSQNQNAIIAVTPAGALAATYALPTPGSLPFGITNGPDGSLWFVEGNTNAIGRITTAGVLTEYPTPSAGSHPFSICNGPDGNLWFTELFANKVGYINPTTHAITEFTAPTAGAQPHRITLGPDGNLWFTELIGNRIGRVTPGGTITEYPIPSAGASLAGIIAGPDGNLWFAEYGTAKIGKLIY